MPLKKLKGSGRKARAWARYKRVRKDNIKTAGDVRAAVRAAQPATPQFTTTTSTMSTTVFAYQYLSKLIFSNSNNTPYARKSTNIRVGHASFRGRLTVQDSPGNLCRLMVVRLKNTDIAPDAWTPQTMFEYNDGTGTQPDNLYASPNTRMVEVKYDKMFNLQNTTAAAPATRMQDIYLNFKVKFNETWKYAACETGQSPFTRNNKNYFVVAFSDSATGTPHPRIILTSCVWFKNISNNA